jgi:heme exporter protein A
VALARLTVARTPLWILDEPLTALDVAALDQFAALCRNHLEQGGMLLFTTHQPLEIPGMGAAREVALS